MRQEPKIVFMEESFPASNPQGISPPKPRKVCIPRYAEVLRLESQIQQVLKNAVGVYVFHRRSYLCAMVTQVQALKIAGRVRFAGDVLRRCRLLMNL